MAKKANLVTAFFDGLTKVIKAVMEHSFGTAKATAIVLVTLVVSPIVNQGIHENRPFIELCIGSVVFIVAIIAMISLAAKADRKR